MSQPTSSGVKGHIETAGDSPPPSSERSHRRGPNAERREVTRSRAFDAAVEDLYEYGYAGSSVASVARRAGCSRGALLKQFPTKAALYAELAEKVLDSMRAENLTYVRSFPRGVDRALARFDHTWELYKGQSAPAVLEVLLGTRADPELSERLKPIVRARYLIERQLFELDIEDMRILDSQAAYIVTFQVLATIRGLAIERILGADDDVLEAAYLSQREQAEGAFERLKVEADISGDA